ncbi:MAG: hypothetical protein HeimC3_42320 [Candidatus Heimdallarchaeota archaeon LC_3]|nr:MAG: hypothetical protein HeimC3_42320 [Candidatus Heimdallarchaeota archaeon LC_3]
MNINQSSNDQDSKEFRIEIPVLQTQYNSTKTFSEVGKNFPFFGMRMYVSFKNDVFVDQMNIFLNLVFVRTSNAPIFQTSPGYGYFTSFSTTKLNYTTINDVFYTHDSVFGYYLAYNITDKSINNDLLKEMSVLLKIQIVFAREQAEINRIFNNPETVDFNIQYLPFILLILLILRHKRDF